MFFYEIKPIEFEPFKIKRYVKKYEDYKDVSVFIKRIAKIDDEFKVEEGFIYDSYSLYDDGKKYSQYGIDANRLYHYFYLIQKRTDIFGFQTEHKGQYRFYLRDNDMRNLIPYSWQFGGKDLYNDYEEAVRFFEKWTGVRIKNIQYQFESDNVNRKLMELLMAVG